jgi:hypothetical protein
MLPKQTIDRRHPPHLEEREQAPSPLSPILRGVTRQSGGRSRLHAR